MSGSASDWESKGRRDKLRTGLARGLGVAVSKVNVTSSVAGSAIVSFTVFQDETYIDSVSVRAKLLQPASAARVARLIEALTGADVVAGPYATREMRVSMRGGRARVAAMTWVSLGPPELAGIAIAALALCVCCAAACALAHRRRQRTARGEWPLAGVLVSPVPLTGPPPSAPPAKQRDGADRLSVQSYRSSLSASTRGPSSRA
jgi:hypothetical protein